MSYDDAPSASDLAQDRYEENSPTCKVQGHLFDYSKATGEALGRCHRCGISIEGAEMEDELAEDENAR